MADIRIELRVSDRARAGVALDIAQSFATVFLDRGAGPRRGVVYQGGGRAWLAYWTKARAVVVRELPLEVPRG